ncbi:MAG: endolytic transglycosylase MltG, partial [Candidatus Acidiferrales bacterium]
MKKWLWIIPVAAALSAGLWLTKELTSPYRGYAGRQVVIIQPGASAPAVAESLVRHGVLAYRLPFLARYWLGRRRRETIKFGEYLFDRPLTASQVYWKLVRGEVYLHAVVIPEGSDRFDMARIYQQTLGVDPEAFLAATHNPESIHDLDPQAASLEGYLFPDTYRFPRGVSPAVIVETMLARFRKVLKNRFAQDLPAGPEALHNVMTLASLVEKETPSPE